MKGRNLARRFKWTLGLSKSYRIAQGKRPYLDTRRGQNDRLERIEAWLMADPSYIPEIEIWCSLMKSRPVDECVDIINLAIRVGCPKDFIEELYDNTQEPLWYAVGDFTLLQISREAHESADDHGRGHQHS